MAKLHEVLAAEPTAKNQSQKCIADLVATFGGKRHLFGRTLSKYIPFKEGEREQIEEQSEIQSTIPKELDWITKIFSKSIDLSFQIDESNTLPGAKADILLDDGTVIAAGVSSIALLQLEKRVQDIHNFVGQIPTLDPAKGFTPDAAENGISIARLVSKIRTKKEQRPLVLYQATPEHPAQTQLIVEDVAVGRLETQEWSGLITPKEKADMLTRCEELVRAVKTARARSNQVEASNKKIGTTLLEFVFKAKVPAED